MVKIKCVTGVLYNVCVFIHEEERVISHETMKLVKMIEMLIMRLSLNASWRISGVRKSNLQFFPPHPPLEGFDMLIL